VWLQSCVAANLPDLDAGLAAQMAPHLLQQTAEAARARADEADLQRIMRMGLGPLDTGDDEALWVCASVVSVSRTGPTRQHLLWCINIALRPLWCSHQLRQQSAVMLAVVMMMMMMVVSRVHRQH
jgi:hypothetical protein